MLYDPKTMLIIALYSRMPGAPPPPDPDGDPHWDFCAAVVEMTLGASMAYGR